MLEIMLTDSELHSEGRVWLINLVLGFVDGAAVWLPSLWAASRSLRRGWLERRCGEKNGVTPSVPPLSSGRMSCLPASERIRMRIASHKHHCPPSLSLFLPHPSHTHKLNFSHWQPNTYKLNITILTLKIAHNPPKEYSYMFGMYGKRV